jgi:hypothetical protein
MGEKSFQSVSIYRKILNSFNGNESFYKSSIAVLKMLKSNGISSIDASSIVGLFF